MFYYKIVENGIITGVFIASSFLDLPNVVPITRSEFIAIIPLPYFAYGIADDVARS